MTASPSLRLHRKTDNLTLHKCHSRGNLKGKNLQEKSIRQTSKNIYCTHLHCNEHLAKVILETCLPLALAGMFSKFTEPSAALWLWDHFGVHLPWLPYSILHRPVAHHPFKYRGESPPRSQEPTSHLQQGQNFPLHFTAQLIHSHSILSQPVT